MVRVTPVASCALAAAASLLHAAPAFPQFGDNVPNAHNVIFDGQLVIGLGHPTPRSPSTTPGAANPFGLDCFPFQNNARNLWPAVCNKDSDGDGLTNGVELCDPDCLYRAGDSDPACLNNAVLSHPGFPGNSGGASDAYIKAHGALMIMAWLFLAPTGILMATCSKKSGKPTWFKVHKACMGSAVALTMLAFLVMIIKQGASFTLAHPKIGITVVLLAIVQPLSGIFRVHLPPKGEAKSRARLLWEAQHQWTGRTTVILATAAIITGLPLGLGVSSATGAAGVLLAIVLAVVGAGSFAYVFLVRDRNRPPTGFPAQGDMVMTDVKIVSDDVAQPVPSVKRDDAVSLKIEREESVKRSVRVPREPQASVQSTKSAASEDRISKSNKKSVASNDSARISAMKQKPAKRDFSSFNV